MASAKGTAGVYVAQSSVFSNPVAGFDPPYPPGDLTNMPGIVLARGLMGDANMDGKVDINDLTVLTNYNQSTGMVWTTGDFNGDGKVDINDLTIVLTNYNTTIGTAASGGSMAAVPEPGPLAILAAGLVGLMVLTWKNRR